MGELQTNQSCGYVGRRFSLAQSVEALPEIAERLLHFQIENRPALDGINLYDDRQTLFYCDPPYLHSTRGDSKAYAYEMVDSGHHKLADVLNRVKGKVALSGYRNKLMDKLFQGVAAI